MAFGRHTHTTTTQHTHGNPQLTLTPAYAHPASAFSQHRGVTMMVPDREIIMKVKLTGAGYIQNALCAKKFNVLYRLCEEQLSKQAHYDFGLRNILAVLRTCGSSKRDAGKDETGSLEPMLVMRTLRDMNLSKFVAEDVPLFLALIDDLFPGLKAAKMEHPMVEPAVDKAVVEKGLQLHKDWVNKIIQVYEMCLVRHSLMLVGPSGTGKSRIIEVLRSTLIDRGAARRVGAADDWPAAKVHDDEPEGHPLWPDVWHARHRRQRVDGWHLRAALAQGEQGQEELYVARP